MRLAIAGKGGSGKTSISGTMARLLARSGRDVLAIDADANPNLALTLGVPAQRMSDVPLLSADLLTWGHGAVLTRSLDEIKEDHGLIGSDGVRLLTMALPQTTNTGCISGLHATVRKIIDAMPTGENDVCILDTDASPEIFLRGVPMYVDAILLVVEPYFKSLETGRRMAALATDLGLDRVALLANKLRDEDDLEAVRAYAERHGLEFGGGVPFDAGFPAAEHAGLAPLDHMPDSPAIRAIGEIGRRWADISNRRIPTATGG